MGRLKWHNVALKNQTMCLMPLLLLLGDTTETESLRCREDGNARVRNQVREGLKWCPNVKRPGTLDCLLRSDERFSLTLPEFESMLLWNRIVAPFGSMAVITESGRS